MKRPCRNPRCRALVDRAGYCPACEHLSAERHRTYDRHRRAVVPELKVAAEIRNSTRWKKVRAQKLSEQPLCEDPHGRHPRRTVTASQVHHIEPLATRPDLAFSASNLMSVCTRCHDVFNRAERSPTLGGGSKVWRKLT